MQSDSLHKTFILFHVNCTLEIPFRSFLRIFVFFSSLFVPLVYQEYNYRPNWTTPSLTISFDKKNIKRTTLRKKRKMCIEHSNCDIDFCIAFIYSPTWKFLCLKLSGIRETFRNRFRHNLVNCKNVVVNSFHDPSKSMMERVKPGVHYIRPNGVPVYAPNFLLYLKLFFNIFSAEY